MMGVWAESPPPVSEGVCALPKVEGIVKIQVQMGQFAGLWRL